MDKLQEIISDLSLWHLASEEELQPFDINAGPCYIIEKSYVKEIMIGFMKKQQAIIEENKRQQEVTVHQFRQAQKEIRRFTKESDGFKQALEKIAALKPSTNNDINACNFQFAITTANLALEGDAE
ncbi:VWA domain-containing protein [Bacillus inaquosorum]|uniref:VWA domain-containing protein n=1 Tax=Bacillus inaquosorum TaxID=483913 RepID=UPI00228123E9|nr:VWA domain-containing protein [Bacillus inaquosorum]MCY8081754.1 VWA domain-containing protein [Bacillus inaquosorum]MCY8704987.1 VWA domain-containing protein [Bacillus inaquosorum]